MTKYPRFGLFYGFLVVAGLATSLVFGYTLLTYWMTMALWSLAVLVDAGLHSNERGRRADLAIDRQRSQLHHQLDSLLTLHFGSGV